jgi:tight adherence protein C
MDAIIFLSILLGLFFLGLSLLSIYKYLVQKRDLKDHLSEQSITTFTTYKKKQTRKEKLLNQVFKFADDFSTLGHRINFFSESHEVEKWLMQSGYPYSLTVDRFQGLKIFLLLMGFFLGVSSLVLGFPLSQFSVILLPIIGYFGAILWLKGKAKSRQEELSYTLPDFLDTMSVTLSAGVGLDQALRDIVPYFPGPIKEEFGKFLQQIDVGVPREQAYQTLIARNDSKEFQLLVKALIQGERLGVPISSTFKIQATEMRKLKKERVKEQAAKASPKVTLITTFIVMPSALILIGGLMIMNMFSTNQNLFKLFQ